jgi:ATP-binding cassette, subfamily C, bacterial LapB
MTAPDLSTPIAESLTFDPALSVPSPSLLGKFLTQKGWSFEDGRLTQTLAQQPDQVADWGLFGWLTAVMTGADLRGCKFAVLPFARLDLRELPVLGRIDGQWVLIERHSEDLALVSGCLSADLSVDQNGPQLVNFAALAGCLTIWMARKLGTEPSETADLSALNLVMRALFRRRTWVLHVVVATLVINIMAIATSTFTMQVYDRVIPTLAYATLFTLVAGMAVVTSLDWLLKVIRARIMDAVGARADRDLSAFVFDHLMHVRMDKMPASLGLVASQVGALDSVRGFLSSAVIIAIIDLPFSMLFLVFIVAIAGNVVWVYIVAILLSLGAGLWTFLRLRHLTEKIVTKSHEKQGFLVDAVRGSETIRAARAGWRFADGWAGLQDLIGIYDIQQKDVRNSSSNFQGALAGLANIAAVVVGVFEVAQGNMSQGAMVAVSILGGRILGPFTQVAQLMTQAQQVKQSLKLVDQLLALPRERRADANLLMPENLSGSLSCEGVKFSYPDTPTPQLALPSVSLNPGDRVLVLGPNGCGKSTLLKVLAGQFPPSEGRVLYGHVDLWAVDPRLLERRIGYLPQTVHLFKGTLRDNVQLSGSISDDRLLEVARDLGLDQIGAESSQGLQRIVQEGGIGLSGGQRQLVALARMIATKPTVWLLDEPTASLDTESEMRSWEVLFNTATKDDIVVVATHKPMTMLKYCNRVIVMKAGAILRDAPPDQLFPQMARRADTSDASLPSSSDQGPQNVQS